MGMEIARFGSYWQNSLSADGKYSYKYYRERSWHGNFPGVSLGGFATSYAAKFMARNGQWFDFQKLRHYKNGYYGNQHRSAASVAKGKSIAKWASKGLAGAGAILGVYGGYQTVKDYNAGKYSLTGASYLVGSDIIGIAGGLPGAAWSLGTSLGRSIVESDWYFDMMFGGMPW